MSITFKLTPIKLQNGKVSLLEEIDSVYFPDDVWNNIKQYLLTKLINVITKQEYKILILNSNSSLFFGTEYFDCSWFVKKNKTKLRKQLKLTSSIHKIILKTKIHPKFLNIANKLITYDTPVCCDITHPTSFNYKGFTSSWNPLGDAIIVIN